MFLSLPFSLSLSLSIARANRSLCQVKRLSENSAGDAKRGSSTTAKGDEHGDGRETSPRPSWSVEEEEEEGGGGQQQEGEEAPQSSTEKLRDGIRAALSSIVPYKSQWPHVHPELFWTRK